MDDEFCLPFPTLLVNLVTLSLKPKTVFLTKLAAPYHCSKGVRLEAGNSNLCNPDAQFFIPMNDNTMERFVEDVCNTGADVGKEPDWGPDEIR